MNDQIDAKVQNSFDRDAVMLAVLTIAQAISDGHADPAENNEAEASVKHLADLLGNVPTLIAAEGIQLALFRLLFPGGLETAYGEMP